MSKHIPKNQLKHTAVINTYVDANTVNMADRTLTHVDIQAVRQKKTGTDGNVVNNNTLMFVDSKHSKIDGVAVAKANLKIDSIVTFRGDEFTIISVEDLDGNSGETIHWEVVMQ